MPGIRSKPYGGWVITSASVPAPNVQALVYIAAYVPDEGETLRCGLTPRPDTAA